MLQTVRSRLTYANVVATGALFVALGGGAYALTGAPDRNGVYHGCVASSGALRVVASASSCRTTRAMRKLANRPSTAARPLMWPTASSPITNG